MWVNGKMVYQLVLAKTTIQMEEYTKEDLPMESLIILEDSLCLMEIIIKEM